jgi:hypothetical protein
MCQKGAILLDSVDLAQAQNCQVDLTHALDYTPLLAIKTILLAILAKAITCAFGSSEKLTL